MSGQDLNPRQDAAWYSVLDGYSVRDFRKNAQLLEVLTHSHTVLANSTEKANQKIHLLETELAAANNRIGELKDEISRIESKSTIADTLRWLGLLLVGIGGNLVAGPQAVLGIASIAAGAGFELISHLLRR